MVNNQLIRGGIMIADIVNLHASLKATLKEFGNVWPNFVVSSKVWQLPLLAEQKATDHIGARALEGCAAIEAALQAMSMFERMDSQAPGTVMRLPGYFALSESVLHWVREINQLKDQLMLEIEKTRVELNLAPSARSKILRQALGGQMSMKQLLRHIQAFDICPRLIIFTWAGHTTGGERVAVGKVRELLGKTAKQQAMKEVIESKFVRRSVDLKFLDSSQEITQSGMDYKWPLTLKQGLDQEKAKQVSKIIREKHPKVKSSIQGDDIRVVSASRDELQAVMQTLRGEELPFAVSFENFR